MTPRTARPFTHYSLPKPTIAIHEKSDVNWMIDIDSHQNDDEILRKCERWEVKHYLSHDIRYWVPVVQALLFRALFQNIDHLFQFLTVYTQINDIQRVVSLWIQNMLDYNFPCVVNKNEWAPMVRVFTKEWTISPFLLVKWDII